MGRVKTCKWFCVMILFLMAACQPENLATPAAEVEYPTVVASTTPQAVFLDSLPVVTATEPQMVGDGIPEPTATALPTVQPQPTWQICSPLAEETILELWEIVSDPYNPPPAGRDERHQGVDFSHWRRRERSSIEGEVIQAILPGVVAAAIHDRLPYGNMIIIETPGKDLPTEIADALGMGEGESLYHLYAHMQNPPQLSLGENVTCGEALGTVGMSGYNIVNPHLHLEMRLGPAGERFEGMVFYDTSATLEEMEQYRLWRTSGTFRHFDPMELFRLTSILDFAMLTRHLSLQGNLFP